MKLWHDDIRRPPDTTWVWARTNQVAKEILNRHGVEVDTLFDWVTEISLDHDMGLHDADPDAPGADLLVGHAEETGRHLLEWMILQDLVPAKVTLHSMNPVGAEYMKLDLVKAAEDRVLGRHITLRVEPYRPR